MSSQFSSVGVIGKPGDPKVTATVRRLVDHLRQRGLEVIQEAEVREFSSQDATGNRPLGWLSEHCDLVIVVGGDGTLLRAARPLAAHGIPILGVNLGGLGFLVDILPSRMVGVVDQVLAGEYEEDRRFLLHAQIGSLPNQGVSCLALNDVVLAKWNTNRVILFDTFIDGQFVNRQSSDGVIIATPTGSTAYALSGGGPLIHPALNALVVVPICPHTLSQRPLVVSGDSRVAVALCREDHDHARVSCDGQILLPIGLGERLYVGKYQHPVRLLHPKGHDHYQILRAKLGWGERPVADN